MPAGPAHACLRLAPDVPACPRGVFVLNPASGRLRRNLRGADKVVFTVYEIISHDTCATLHFIARSLFADKLSGCVSANPPRYFSSNSRVNEGIQARATVVKLFACLRRDAADWKKESQEDPGILHVHKMSSRS